MLVFEDDLGREFIDSNSIVADGNNTRVANVLTDYNQRRDKQGDLSGKSIVRVKCNEFAYYLLGYELYSGNMGRGSVLKKHTFDTPVKYAKNKLDCEAIAKNYILKNKNVISYNSRELKMLSTNFCYGGEEIYEIENLKN